MANFFEDVGSFFKDLGAGITGTLQGVGMNLQSQSILNQAQAEQIRANAQVTQQALLLEFEQNQLREKNKLLIIAIAFGVPLIAFVLYLTLKK